MTTPNHRKDERGASLVEFAVIAPLLLMVLFGIIESGWAFSQQLEIRHGAREGARLASINYGGTEGSVVTEACSRMDHTTGGAAVTLAHTGTSIGETAIVTVSAPNQSLTGFMDWVFGGVTIDSTAEMRIEQAITWTPVTLPCP